MFYKLQVNVSFLVLILSSGLYSSSDFQPQFAKSLKEEFEEVAEYYTDPAVETVEDVKQELLDDPDVFRKIHYPNDVISFSDWIEWYSQNGSSQECLSNIQDAYKTFTILKQVMLIPNEVEIWYCSDQELSSGFMGYRSIERTVYVYPQAWDQSPAYRLFTLIHELVHTQQHMRSGLLRHHLEDQDDESRALHEHEADVNAANSIKCPLCFKSVVAYQLLRERTATVEQLNRIKVDGYLLSDDLKECLQHKSLQDLCSVHQNASNVDILSGLDSKENLMQIYEDDCALGCMSDRLSSVKFNK